MRAASVAVLLGFFLGMFSPVVEAQGASQMKINAGFVTKNLKDTKDFYINKLGFKIRYESDWYLLLHTGGQYDSDLAFMVPNHPTQPPIFQSEFKGKGAFITIEVPNVDLAYNRFKALGVPIQHELKNEDWGDRHFVIVDPNGIGLDFVTHTRP